MFWEEWTPVTVYEVMVKIVARVSNNAFSGMEFCTLAGHLIGLY